MNGVGGRKTRKMRDPQRQVKKVFHGGVHTWSTASSAAARLGKN